MTAIKESSSSGTGAVAAAATAAATTEAAARWESSSTAAPNTLTGQTSSSRAPPPNVPPLRMPNRLHGWGQATQCAVSAGGSSRGFSVPSPLPSSANRPPSLTVTPRSSLVNTKSNGGADAMGNSGGGGGSGDLTLMTVFEQIMERWVIG